MKISEFKKGLSELNYVMFDDDTLLLFNDLELYNRNTETSVKFNSFDEMLTYECNGLTMKKRIEEKKDFKIYISGGRGSGLGDAGRTLFPRGGTGALGEGAPSTYDLPARMNRMYNGNQMSQEHTLATFREQHGKDYNESLIAYDDDGFVHVYSHGNGNSVGVDPSKVAGLNVMHNHPPTGWANFSSADLDTWAGTDIKGLGATSTAVTYQVRKGNNFDAKGFSKAVANAKTTETSYDKAVANFLKRNQKKYGYTYTETWHQDAVSERGGASWI